MASRPILPPQSVITAGDMSADITSLVTVVQNVSIVSYDLSWAGSNPVGVATVEVSNTYSQNVDGTVRSAGTWRTYPGATAAVSGNSGNGYFDISGVGGYAVRLIYTFTSGTGTMNATINGKVA